MSYILPTVITLICTPALFVLIKYFSSRTTSSEKEKTREEIIKKFCVSKPEDKSSTSVRSYRITFSPELIQDLKTRLNTRKKPNKPNNVIQTILNYWANDYDFQKREEYINKYPQFIKVIQGLSIHYVHVKPNSINKQIVPLLMLHGWPSSIMEFYKIIPLLTVSREEYDFVFEVIIPSLPGFGFSDAPTIANLSCVHMSIILRNFMLSLKHYKFYVHSGDWGIFISRTMSSLYPQNVLGTHSNVCAILDRGNIPSYSALAKVNRQITLLNKGLEDTKYFQIQSMKPETIGVGLRDSPAALATYIFEKFLIGTNYSEMNDEILKKYSYDELIDNIMIYWTSANITDTMRIYAKQFTESENELFAQLINSNVEVPSAQFSQFLNKIPTSSTFRKQYKDIFHITYTERTGRFPAFEKPKLFAEDILAKINKMQKQAR